MQISYISAEMNEEFDRAVRLGAAAGVETVSLRSRLWGTALEDLDKDQIRRTLDTLQAHAMRPGMLLSPVGKCTVDDAATLARNGEILKRTFDMAHRLGSDKVRVFPFRAPSPTAFGPSQLDDYFAQIVEGWAPWVEWAAAAQMALCFEWVGTTLVLTSQEMRRVIDALGAPNHVGVIWEIDTSAQAGEDPGQGYPHLQGFIRDVHIKSFDGGASRSQYLDALRLLRRDGYNGPLTVEHWGGEAETLAGIAAVGELQAESASG
ncbi:MAG: TIM barrel protein [Candidatus Latescibacteria bacterium]|nr:TIM barrel protein [Candidatus Latescibacterota bacterium]